MQNTCLDLFGYDKSQKTSTNKLNNQHPTNLFTTCLIHMTNKLNNQHPTNLFTTCLQLVYYMKRWQHEGPNARNHQTSSCSKQVYQLVYNLFIPYIKKQVAVFF
jgi:hypothetical protein